MKSFGLLSILFFMTNSLAMDISNSSVGPYFGQNNSEILVRRKRSLLYKRLIGSGNFAIFTLQVTQPLTIVEWPPSKSLETLLSFDESELRYDLKEAIEADQQRTSSKRAAHCVIFAKTNLKPLLLVKYPKAG